MHIDLTGGKTLARGRPLVVVPGLHYWLAVAAARSGLVSPGLAARLMLFE